MRGRTDATWLLKRERESCEQEIADSAVLVSGFRYH
jgi:hypothetical protein